MEKVTNLHKIEYLHVFFSIPSYMVVSTSVETCVRNTFDDGSTS